MELTISVKASEARNNRRRRIVGLPVAFDTPGFAYITKENLERLRGFNYLRPNLENLFDEDIMDFKNGRLYNYSVVL